MIQLTLQLLLAHITGDFLFQPDRWVKHKEEHKFKSKYLYWHIVVHALALLVALQFDTDYWIGVLLILVSHYIIDLTKLQLIDKFNRRYLFFADQFAHLFVIFLVVYYYKPFEIDPALIYSNQVLLLVIAILTTTIVSSILMKVVISRWDIDEDDNTESLKKAGKYIGMLERMFVFGFIVFNQWQAIGFLLTAKSVFRFGDLSKSKDRKLTEYILIGTLLSFGLAILTGLLYNYFAKLIGK